MNYYKVYKQIKAELGNAVPVFYFIGQYLPGKENTSYKIPAIYIEFPKDTGIDFYGKKLMTLKNTLIKIHYISYAPFKNADSAEQEKAIDEHEEKIQNIDKVLNGWNAKDANGNNITEQLIPNGGSFNEFTAMAIVSVINYKTELYSNHLNN